MGQINVVGITASDDRNFNEEVRLLVQKNKVFFGSEKQKESVRDLLREDYQWNLLDNERDISLDHILKEKEDIVIFTYGDPWFYGIGSYLLENVSKDRIQIFAQKNIILTLCHKTYTNYNRLTNINLSGLGWEVLDEVLLDQRSLIGILTDKNYSPDQIANRMQDYGYDNYQMIVGENLGVEGERIRHLEIQEAQDLNFKELNCVLLQKKYHKYHDFGIADLDLKGMHGSRNQITKMPVRLTALHALHLEGKSCLWEVGYGTGSLSLEAKRQFPALKVIGFEREEQCQDLLIKNARNLGIPGVKSIIGDFLDLDLSELPRPDAVFIGGHDRNVKSILDKIHHYLNDNGMIVISTIDNISRESFFKWAAENKYSINYQSCIKVDAYNAVDIISCRKS
ncbi:precorrin-6y C5,15-methyltransferase (decarboxylating) subunit CbiE [Aureibacter tunicatorum]|uniref:Precorrin-6Y C5,15-methyltransferase (Decarboxylating) n=1 Tax=Aureibacter tunicatorum TaxID=866807 RepID=A0AAE4BV62_9BACT|nr:precorrin-6y C5,15-methyltransferase (decarboxylating) subunit CbiE [Aureibacter tunicatorum]MDR6241557.1 precorrin-6Y C5,15-methyltransferase (decarboxylating) [Aureibacter tunicatorum]BDD07219.1 precorrin-6Y C5,15-methyltransferase [Aureibacter tunicatorum]